VARIAAGLLQQENGRTTINESGPETSAYEWMGLEAA